MGKKKPGFKTLHDIVAIKQDEARSESAGGIAFPRFYFNSITRTSDCSSSAKRLSSNRSGGLEATLRACPATG